MHNKFYWCGSMVSINVTEDVSFVEGEFLMIMNADYELYDLHYIKDSEKAEQHLKEVLVKLAEKHYNEQRCLDEYDSVEELMENEGQGEYYQLFETCNVHFDTNWKILDCREDIVGTMIERFWKIKEGDRKYQVRHIENMLVILTWMEKLYFFTDNELRELSLEYAEKE